MTGKERHQDHDAKRLAQLYREQGDIEPGPGVDQRIRERARNEARPASLPRPAHWLGGVAVAASLFVVVSVVTNIQPPEAELPASETDRASGQSESVETDRSEASDFMPERQRQSKRGVLAEPAMERAAPTLSAPLPEPQVERRARESAADDAERTAREKNESLGASRQADSRRADTREMLQPAEEAELGLLEQEMTDAQRQLWLIERFLSVGNVAGARAEIEAFRRQHPDEEVPQRLVDRLENLEAEAAQN
jgi:hypothetical protein